VEGEERFAGGIASKDRVLFRELPREFRSSFRALVDPEEGKGPWGNVEGVPEQGPQPEVIVEAIP